jgi:hypothetical protein
MNRLDSIDSLEEEKEVVYEKKQRKNSSLSNPRN